MAMVEKYERALTTADPCLRWTHLVTVEDPMGNTFGDFAVAVACGTERSRTLSVEKSDQIHLEMCQSVGPRIEALRQAQRESARQQIRPGDWS